MSSVFVGAASVNIKTIDMNNCSTDQMELPIWSHENFWIYDMNFEFEFENIFSADGSIEDLKMIVIGINESAGEYNLAITGYLHAQLKIFGIGVGSYNADITGTAHINVSDLAIKEFEFFANGQYLLSDTDVTVHMAFDPAFDFLDFPIDPTEEPWEAETCGTLDGHITVGSIFDSDFNAEGPFENETISFVKQEDVTVPGGSFDCFLLSGLMGPSHGGWSNLWYSSEAGYLVDIDEKIINWEGVTATLSLPLQATNYDPGNREPKTLSINMFQIQSIDPIDEWIWPSSLEPEWYYTVKVTSGDNIQYQSNYNTDTGTYNGNWISQEIWTPDITHDFSVYSRWAGIEIQLLDYDSFWEGGEDDVADISSDEVRRTFIGTYDLLEDKLIGMGGMTDNLSSYGPYYFTSGELDPDGSTGSDEDDAAVLFQISDNYERPQIPSRPSGPTSGEANVEYIYSTSTIDPDGDKVRYKWDWGDGTFSDWIGPFDSGVIAEASHTWVEQGSYEIKVKAKDVYDAESIDWSESLPVTMPLSQPSSYASSFQQYLPQVILQKTYSDEDQIINTIFLLQNNQLR